MSCVRDSESVIHNSHLWGRPGTYFQGQFSRTEKGNYSSHPEGENRVASIEMAARHQSNVLKPGAYDIRIVILTNKTESSVPFVITISIGYVCQLRGSGWLLPLQNQKFKRPSRTKAARTARGINIQCESFGGNILYLIASGSHLRAVPEQIGNEISQAFIKY